MQKPRAPKPAPDFETALKHGVELFNRHQFFEAHEVWEEAWLTHPGEPAYFLQGLIQIAAGFVKLQRGEPRGASLNLTKGRSKLERFAPSRHRVEVAALLADTTRWVAAAERMAASGLTEYDPTTLPRIRVDDPEIE